MMLCLCCLGWLAAGDDAAPQQRHWTEAITAPSEDLSLAFVISGKIAAVLVEEGQKLAPGQPLVQLDDAVERVRLGLLKARAENTTPIKAAQLRLDRCSAILKKIEKAYAENASPERELEEARMNKAEAELSLEMSRFEHEQDEGKYTEARLALERMRLLSPAAGRVEQTLVKPGESVDALAPVIRIVRIDPLWIDVPVPLPRAGKLKPGQAALARFSDPQEAPVTGRILRIAAVADAASETLEVRVALPNPTGRPAGEHVTVCFPAGDPTTAPAKKTPG
ncbi:MAG: hypothetical protein AMJ81_11570 [Phycisphaerae bacterium SM23_33]|nr:MAG: hypothetical protein AMJ81_11570 [Phycisphaerae bacterium SM23_33]